MPAFDFTPEGGALVKSGSKLQTIRKPRAIGRQVEVGDELVFYVGRKSPRPRMIGRSRVAEILEIDVASDGTIIVDEIELSGESRERLANRDGFRTTLDLLAFLDKTYGLPFRGFVIRWEGLEL